MLGLGSSVNSEEGYAKGERYRERFHTGGTWGETTNPLGRQGKESDYIGDFATGTDADLYTLVNVGSEGIAGGEFKYRASATNGYAWVTFSVVPNTSYTLTCTYDKSSIANGTGRVAIGTSAGDSSISISSLLSTGDTDVSLTFNSGANSYLYLSLIGTTAGRFSYWDDISLKES
jgi:hypothetical protein